MKTEWDGMEEVKNNIHNFLQSQKGKASTALFMEGEELMSASKPLVPVRHGTLRRSGHVTLPQEDSSGNVFVDVGFGGPAGTGNQGETNENDVGYALPVHEDLEAHHTVGQAKYLEQPFNERKDGMLGRIASRTKSS